MIDSAKPSRATWTLLLIGIALLIIATPTAAQNQKSYCEPPPELGEYLPEPNLLDEWIWRPRELREQAASGMLLPVCYAPDSSAGDKVLFEFLMAVNGKILSRMADVPLTLQTAVVGEPTDRAWRRVEQVHYMLDSRLYKGLATCRIDMLSALPFRVYFVPDKNGKREAFDYKPPCKRRG